MEKKTLTELEKEYIGNSVFMFDWSIVSVKNDVSDLLKGKGDINAGVFVNPSKYAISILVDRIVADSKVSRKA